MTRAVALALASAIATSGCGARTGLGDDARAAPIVEACNGEDDDGDGTVDEDVPPLECGVGACRNAEPGCPVDRPPSCEPLAPHDEVCNTVDDDCDGRTDEGLGFGVVGGPYTVADETNGYFTSDLVAVDGGMVSVWNVGFDGSHPPVTNAFGRHLTVDGEPDADPRAILGRPVTMGLTAAPSPQGVALMYCGRFGAEDHPASAFLDALGVPTLGEMRRGTDGRSCGAVVQSAIWTGSSHLYAWITNGGAADGSYPVFVDVADANGATRSGMQVELHGDLYTAPSFARSGEVVALAYGVRPEIRRSAIDVVRLDADGNALGPALRVGEVSVDEHAFGSAHVVPDGAGGLVVVTSDPNGPGLYAARIDANGRITRALARIETGERRFDQLDVAARPGGEIVIVANAYVGPESTFYAAALGTDLEVVATWEPGPTLPYSLVPALDASTGRIFVQGGEPDGHVLALRELGCVP